MADKNNTSSLLEAIKSKLSKFDNKPKPAENKSSVNYFSQDLQNTELEKASLDKTNIGLIFDAEKKLENIRRKNLNQNINKQKDIDLDLDDESLNVKNLGQKISIESKIKEIADELNLEEFEDDFEYQETEDIVEENIDDANKNLDPIDIELMELEKEVAKKNQQKTQNNYDPQISEDLNLKSYLDSKFEDEIENIEKEIALEENNKIFEKIDPTETLETTQNKEYNINLNNINFDPNKNQFSFKITPAQEFLASSQGQIETKIAEEKVEQNLVKNDIAEEKVEQNLVKNDIAEEKVEQNLVKNDIAEEKVEQNLVAERIVEEKSQNNVIEILNNTLPNQDYQASTLNNNFEKKTAETINISENYIAQKPIEPNLKYADLSKINYQENSQKNIIENQIITEKTLQSETKSIEENVDKNNEILEKINYNLIHEETIFQASNSMKKLMEAKNLVNNVSNFARDETLTKIAINLMEPKLEKWLNDNLPSMVENIVREEIEKIVPKV